jgi:hypothetical protein
MICNNEKDDFIKVRFFMRLLLPDEKPMTQSNDKNIKI